MTAGTRTSLIGRLPPLRGALHTAAPLRRVAWFRVGGPAEVLFAPADRDDLGVLLSGRPPGVPVTVLGLCSNVLIRDGGIDGVVVRLGRSFARIAVDGTRVHCGAAAADATVARAAAAAGIGGLEFLCGVPGSIGGAIRMNAGAYGCEIGEVVETVEAVDPKGVVHRLAGDDIDFGYRRSSLPANWICTAATLRGTPVEASAVRARMAAIAARREATQPIRARTGGSTFTNPPGRKAWQLIDSAGCRGLRRGGAAVSLKHSNFLVNIDGATAGDLECLGETVRRRVFETAGVRLEWEIRRLGRHVRPEGAP